MRELSNTELFLLGEGEDLKYYSERLYKRYKDLVAELEAMRPKEIPEGKKLMTDPFVGYILVDK